MLKKRLLTAAILIPLVVLAILFLPPFVFAGLLAVLLGYAGWEWSYLSGLSHTASRIAYLSLLIFLFIFSFLLPLPLLVIIVALWWLTAFILLMLYPRGAQVWGQSLGLRSLMGVLVLVPCVLSLSLLQSFGGTFLVYSLALIWLVDSVAYFVGVKWGRHKLVPRVSPGKTYEGLLAGLLASTLMAFYGLWLFSVPKEQWIVFVILIILGGGLITVLGDLFESMMKRVANVKDSGSLFPGHGGVLDRCDSMTSAIPFFALMFASLFFQ